MSDQRTANLLGAVALAVTDSLVRATQEVAQGPSAPAAIIRIGTYPGQPIDFLSRALHLSHSATVRLVDRLAAEGLVRRERDTGRRDGDRRSVSLYLTQDGEACLNSILSRRYDVLQPLLDTFSGQEQAQLTAILERLLARLTSPEQAAHICRLCDVESCSRDGCPVGYYPPRLFPVPLDEQKRADSQGGQPSK